VRLERVVDNLLANALKYSPLGGKILVRLARERASSGAWAVLTVLDEGLGVPAADLPLIFEPFRRGGNVGPISGAGIGLASVRQIVEQHGGRVTVTSREGAGSTFTVHLPVESDAAAAGVASQAQVENRGATSTPL
jgi:signal transduction histidine kinase